MADEKLSGRVGLDTTDFKTGLSQMNTQLRVLESGFRASAAGLGDWANNASGLELRIKSLTSQIDIQKNKVAAIYHEWIRVSDEKGKNSRAAQELEIKLNKETEALGKMQSELGETETALADLESGSQDAGNEVEEMGRKAEGIKGMLSGLWTGIQAGIGILAATAAAVVAVGAALGGLVFSGASAAAEIVDLSAKTGISTTRLQELSYIGDQVGVSLDTITRSEYRLTRSMGEAQTGAGDQAQAFEALGISVTDTDGNLRDSQAVFAETLDALNKIENPAQRDVLAMALFGRSAQELNPLIKAGSDEMAAMAEQAHLMGAVMSEDTVAGLESFDDTMASLQAGLKGTLGTLAAAFLPGFQAVFGQVGGYLQEFSAIVSGSGGDFGKIAEGLTGLVGDIVSDLAAQLPELLQAGMDILMSILNGIMTNLPAILTAATALITSLVGFLITAAPVLFQAALQIILTLLMSIIENLPMLIEAALQIIVTLVQGIVAALPTLIPAIVEMLVLIITTIVDNLPMLLEAALQLILGLVQGLAAALPILIAAVPTILIAIVNTLTNMLPVLVEMAPQIIVALITGIIGALPALGEAIPQIIETIITVITDLLPNILDAGVQILKGIWDGIASQLPWFWEQIKSFALGIWDAIKDALGIASPSKLFADTVGPFIPEGIWEGIESGMPDLQRQLTAAMQGLSANYDVAVNGRSAFAGAAAGAAVPGNTYQFTNYIENGGVNADELERIQKREAMLYGG